MGGKAVETFHSSTGSTGSTVASDARSFLGKLPLQSINFLTAAVAQKQGGIVRGQIEPTTSLILRASPESSQICDWLNFAVAHAHPEHPRRLYVSFAQIQELVVRGPNRATHREVC